MKELVIAFDTSNYTTSCAVFDGAFGDNEGNGLPVPEGALGLRQSDALFSHIKSLPEVFNRIKIGGQIIAVGASSKPRETEDSYMPCFLAGKTLGAVLAHSHGVPFYEFSHQQGHIAAAAWSAGKLALLDSPMLCWHLSGGTTELLYVKPRVKSVICKIIGGTSDISAGQLVDRTGNMLGLEFPSGKALDGLALAESGGAGELFKPKCDGSTFSLSGAEHKMRKMLEAGHNAGDAAYFIFYAIVSAVKAATENALRIYGDLPVLFSGGVASSGFLRRELPFGIYCEPRFSADNAMGCAILTHRAVTADVG